MGQLGNLVTELKTEYDPLIISRDERKCALCGGTGNHVHEVLSKSKFSIIDIRACIQPKNMVLLCMRHHGMVQGMPQWSGYLLRLLHERYGYEYEERPFDWYFYHEYPTEEDIGSL